MKEIGRATLLIKHVNSSLSLSLDIDEYFIFLLEAGTCGPVARLFFLESAINLLYSFGAHEFLCVLCVENNKDLNLLNKIV